MTTRKARRRLATILCATAVGGSLLAMSGGPADAATLPVSYIVGSGASAYFSPNGLEAEALPPQCPGYHAGFGVINYTFSPEVIQYYGGRVTIASGAEHVFCIGGTANHYEIQYLLVGTRSLLRILVP
jgi:hypothetical protein